MTTEESHVAALKRAYRQWHETRGGSIDTWMALMAEQVELRSLSDGAPGMEFTNRGHSKDDVLAYLQGLVADWEMLHFTVDEYIVQGERIVMLGHCGWRHRKTGKTLETPKADFWRFRDGQAIEFYEFYDTAKASGATV